MLNKRFCYLAGTGRTATHWLKRIIDASSDKTQVATFHDNFPKRAKVGGRPNTARFFVNYALNLMLANQRAQTYVECNPALLEHVALTYGIAGALSVIPAGLLAQPARAVLVTRHPYTYVASMKAKGYGWSWWDYPRTGQVYDIGDGWAKRPMLERASLAWSCKNAFFHSLTKTDDCLLLKFERLFDYRVTKESYSKRLQGVFAHFGIETIQGASLWWRLRTERAAVKNKDKTKLTAAEKQTVKRLCGDMMEVLEYA